MRSRFFTAVVTCSLALAAEACAASGDDVGTGVITKKDSGVDASSVGKDSGAPATDGSVIDPPSDTGTPTLPPADTGSTAVDTGSTAVDTGSTSVDTGGPATPTPTGGACTSNASCQAGGSTNQCITWLPTPVCGGATCTNAAGANYGACDGALGLCRDDGSGTNTGFCLPKCSFSFSGSSATGCIGTDYCIDANKLTATGGTGTCMGEHCKTDGDCPDPTYSRCQTETMGCVAPADHQTFTKALGAACTYTPTTYASTDCMCYPQSTATATAGVCTVQCVTGSTTNGCPSGYACDPLLGSKSFTTIPSGLVGFCFKKCTAPSNCTVPGTSCYQFPGAGSPICVTN